MTVHQRIMRAAERGTGLRLTVDEIFALSRDQAIAQAASNDDESDRQNEAEAEGQRWADARENAPCNWWGGR